MSYLSLLNSSISLERPVNSQDSSGGILKGFESVNGFQDVAASIQPLRTEEKNSIFAQRQILVTHRIYTAIDMKSQKGDRCRVPETNQIFILIGMRDQAGRHQVYSMDAREQT